MSLACLNVYPVTGKINKKCSQRIWKHLMAKIKANIAAKMLLRTFRPLLVPCKREIALASESIRTVYE